MRQQNFRIVFQGGQRIWQDIVKQYAVYAVGKA